jgi:hypothetical protein
MLKFVSPGGVGGSVAGLPPSVMSVQYLNDDENPTLPFARKNPYEFETAWPVPVGIEPGQRAQDPARGVRDQDRVVVVVERAVVGEEVLQVRHQLEVGREVRPVTHQVRVVELEIDQVLDAAVAVRAEVAAVTVRASARRTVVRPRRTRLR